MTASDQELKTPRQITGRMVLIGFILFFGTITAVNGVLMYFALNTWPGLVTEDSYIKGLKYNDTIAESESQRLLAWNVRVTLDGDKKLRISVIDGNSVSVPGLDVEAVLTRPLGEQNVVILTMPENQSGIYEGEFVAPIPGRWKADIKAVSKTGSVFKSRHEILVKQ